MTAKSGSWVRIPVFPPKSCNALNLNDLAEQTEINGTVPGHNFLTLYNTLAELSKEKKMFFFKPIPHVDYVPPRLTEGKIWYISFYAKDPNSQMLKRVRMKFNRIRDLRQRRATARKIMAALEERLILGWNPFLEATAPKAYTTLFDALDAFLKVKNKELEKESMRVYISYVKIFREWLVGHGFNEKSFAISFGKPHAMEFLADLELNEKISPRTWNNYLAFAKILFNWMMSKDYCSENPFAEIQRKPKKLTRKVRRVISDEELSRLFAYLREENMEYLAICLICYCCLIRPHEIASLRCRDVDLRKQLIYISSEIAKNDKDSYRTIPDDMLPIMRLLDYSKPEWFLFGKHAAYDFSPGPKQICSRKIAKYWSDHVRKACDFPMELQFYSLKDTGITNMLVDGVPINLVQQQADHSSVAMTAVYVGKKPEADKKLRKLEILQKPPVARE